MLKPFFTQKPEKSVEGKSCIQSQHCESKFVPGWTDFFLVPFKESRFPLFGINIQAGKRSSTDPSLKDLARQGLSSFTKRKRSISSEDIEVLYKADQLGLNAPESFANSAPFSTSERQAVKTNAR